MWESEVERYHKSLQARAKPASKSYISINGGYLRALGKRYAPDSFLDLTREEMEDWIIEVREKGTTGRGPLAIASMNSIMAHVKAFFRFLNDDETPKSFSWVKIGRNLPRVSAEQLPSEEELEKLISVMSSRNRAITRLIYAVAARPSEILNLKWVDYREDPPTLTFRETKTADLRTVPLKGKYGKKALRALKAWMIQTPENENGYLFPSPDPRGDGGPVGAQTLWRAFQLAKKNTGFEGRFFPYLLRHAAATRLLGEMPTYMVQTITGWKGPDMARFYGHLGVDDMIKAFEDAEPDEEEAEHDLGAYMNTIQAYIASKPDLEEALTESQEIMMRVLLASPEYLAQMEKIRKLGGEDIPDNG